MDMTKILTELRREREQIEEAILSLEKLPRPRSKRRGRPPAWMRSKIKPPGSDEGGGGAPDEGAAGLPVPRSPRNSRRPPRTGRAGA